MKRAVCVFATVGLIVLAGTTALAADRILWATTGIQSGHYAYAVAAAKAINAHSGDKVDVTVISSGGSTDNLSRLSRGQIQMALTSWDLVYQAYRGIGRYEGKAQPKIRALWLYDVSLSFYVVRADSGVTTLEGLAGKKWNAGGRGTASEQLAQQILTAIDVKPDYFIASITDAVDAVKDGRAIGYAKAGTSTSLDASTLELKATTPIRVLGFTPEQVTRIKAKTPYISFRSLEQGEVEGVGAITTPLVSVGQIAYDDSLTDEQVAAILDGVIKGQALTAAAFPGAGAVDIPKDTIAEAAAMGLPLHTGAVKYFRSKGFSVPDSIVPPEMKKK